MRAVVALALTLSLALTLFIAGFFTASALMAKPAAETFATIDVPDLWPATPRRVAAKDRALERVPAAAPVSLQPSGALPLSQAPIVASGSQDIDLSRPGAADVPGLGEAQAAASPEHLAWCEQRYRSYQAADNSYSAYSGERKPCITPFTDVAVNADMGPEPGSVPSALPDDHVRRCQERYASYRISDNTYQPFGGSRRTCMLD